MTTWVKILRDNELAQGHIWQDIVGRVYLTVWRRGWMGDKYSMCSVSFPCIFHSSSLWLAYWAGPAKTHGALYFRSPNACTYWLTFVLRNAGGCICTVCSPVRSLFTWVFCIWISMGTTRTKQHNSMPAASVGDLCPSALWRVTSGTEWGQNVDPLVSFWWHVYYLFVTLYWEPKETATEDKTVRLILYLYACAFMYMCG